MSLFKKTMISILLFINTLGGITFAAVSHNIRKGQKVKKSQAQYIIHHVPSISQFPQLRNGCEVTSLAMLLNFSGIRVSKMTLAANVNKDTTPLAGTMWDIERWGDPNVGFVGSIYTSPGYGVYHKPLLALAQRYVGKRAVDLTGDSFANLESYIRRGDPVEVINSYNLQPLTSGWQTYEDEFGKKITINMNEHAVLIVGYNTKYVWINNPLKSDGAYEVIPKAQFIAAWRQFGKQAITVLSKSVVKQKEVVDTVTSAVYQKPPMPIQFQPSYHLVVNPDQVYTYAQMQRDIGKLAAMYPDLIRMQVEGKTVYGRNLYAISLGHGKATAYICASHHAREWITTNLVMKMIDQYAYDDEKGRSIAGYNVRKLLNKVTLWFMPMVNPDGVTLEQEGVKAFPKRARAALIAMNGGSTNFITWKANAQGIDPNRQYNGGWYQAPVIVNHPAFAGYKGTRPYEINEVNAVLKLIKQVNPQELITYHASGSEIFWQYQLSNRHFRPFLSDAQAFSKLTAYPVSTPTTAQTGSGLTDWWTHNIGRPGFTIEVGPDEGDMPVPLKYFKQIWLHDEADGLLLAQQSYARYARNSLQNIAKLVP
jgi:g-D-glutamyl-meso-diaminopimelate peptidase